MSDKCEFRPPGQSEGSCDERAILNQWDHRWKREFRMCNSHAAEVRRYNAANRSDQRETVAKWIAGLVVAGLLFAACIHKNLSSAPDPNYPIQGGYENPAPGNDGSYDCPPGGGPVDVGSNDPAGLDGDGDGIGCE